MYIPRVQLNGPAVDSKYPLDVHVPLIRFEDTDSGLSAMRVQLVDTATGFAVAEENITIAEGEGRPAVHVFEVSIASGTTLAAVVTAWNRNGLASIAYTSEPVEFVHQALIAGIVYDGIRDDSLPANASDIQFFWQTTAVHAHWKGFQGTDLTYRMTVWTDGGNVLIPERDVRLEAQEDATLAMGFDVADGTVVFTTIIATDNTNSKVNATSDGVMLDASVPDISDVFIGYDQHEQYVTSHIWVTFNATDEHSGIDGCWLRIVEGAGGLPIVEEYSVSVPTNGGRSRVLLDGVNFTHGVGFSAQLRCRNRAGLEGRGVSDVSMIDVTPPVAGTVYDGERIVGGNNAAYVNGSSRLVAHFDGFRDADSDILGYACCAGTKPGSCDASMLMPVEGYYASTRVCELTGLDLAQGQVYYTTVWAYDRCGRHNVSASSSGVFVDTTAPESATLVAGASTVNETVTTVSNVLSVEWTGFLDAESYIASLTWSAGSTPGGSDIFANRPIDPATALEGSTFVALLFVGRGVRVYLTLCLLVVCSRHRYVASLEIVSGTRVYSSMTATNRAGLSTTVTADAVLVLFEAPLPQRIADGLDINNDIRVMNSSVAAVVWEPFQQRGGEVVGYEWAVCEAISGDCLLEFSPVGLVTNMTNPGLPLEPGVTYYNKIRATNEAGVTAVVVSNGFTVDVTPPIVGQVYDGVEFGVDIDIQGTWAVISASWHKFFDAESSIESYTWCAGLTPGGDDVVECTNVGLDVWASAPAFGGGPLPADLEWYASYNASRNETRVPRFFVTVIATSGVGSTAVAYSDGCDVDISPPVVDLVRCRGGRNGLRDVLSAQCVCCVLRRMARLSCWMAKTGWTLMHSMSPTRSPSAGPAHRYVCTRPHNHDAPSP